MSPEPGNWPNPETPETPPAPDAAPTVLAYGCNRASRLVRIGLGDKPPKGAAPVRVVDCPACHEEHVVSARLHRPRRPGEVCELEAVSVEELRPKAVGRDEAPSAGSGRRTVSDEAIEAAIPPGVTVSAIEAAAAAGYVGAKPGPALVARIRRNPDGIGARIEIIDGGGFKNPTRLRRRQEATR